MAEKEYIERKAFVDYLENAKEILWRDTSLSSTYAAKLVDIFYRNACNPYTLQPLQHQRRQAIYLNNILFQPQSDDFHQEFLLN